MQKKGIPNKKASTSVGGTHSKSKEFHIPQLVDEREHIPPPGFAPSTVAAHVAHEAKVSPPLGFAPSTIPVNEVRVSPPPDFAHQEGLHAGIVLPPAWGVSLRALTDDLVLLTLSIGGSTTRTHRSDRIAGICHSVPKKKKHWLSTY
jgi:hypothetical protein